MVYWVSAVESDEGDLCAAGSQAKRAGLQATQCIKTVVAIFWMSLDRNYRGKTYRKVCTTYYAKVKKISSN